MKELTKTGSFGLPFGLGKYFYLFCAFIGGGLFLFVMGPLDFLLLKKVYFHDSIDLLVKQFLFYNELFSSGLPLWKGEGNLGQPIWPLYEMVPALDPVALLVWGIGYLCRSSSVVPFAWTQFLWLLIFSWGGVLCSRFLYRDWRINLVVFAILFGGPISAGMGMQSPGFLLPFRYLPLSLYFCLSLRCKAELGRALILGGLLSLCLSGYQAFFCILFYSAFLLSVSLLRLTISTTTKKSVPYFLLALGIAGMLLIPDLIAGLKCFNLSLVGRVGGAWFAHPRLLFQGATDFFHWTEPWHGHGYIGLLSLVLIVAYPLAIFWRRRLRFSALEGAWVIVFLIFTVITLVGHRLLLGPSGTFLYLRNWGFTLSLVHFSLSQLVVIGYRHLLATVNRTRAAFFWSSLLLPFCFLLLIKTLPLDKNYFNKNQLIPLLLLPFVVICIQELKRRKQIFIFPWCMFFLLYLDMGLYSRSASNFYDSNSLAVRETLAKAPRLGPVQANLPSARYWKPNSQSHYPYHFEVPAQSGKFYTTSDVTIDSPLGGVMATHWFRLAQYEKILGLGFSDEKLRRILRAGEPLIFVTSDFIPVQSPEEALQKLSETDGSKLIIEGLSMVQISALTGSANRKSHWRIKGYQPSRLSLEVEVLHPSILVYSDNIDEDWSALVDGKKEKLLTANGTLKAVYLAPGTHQVEFAYLPMLYVLSFWLRFFVVFVLTLLGIQSILIRIKVPAPKLLSRVATQ